MLKYRESTKNDNFEKYSKFPGILAGNFRTMASREFPMGNSRNFRWEIPGSTAVNVLLFMV